MVIMRWDKRDIWTIIIIIIFFIIIVVIGGARYEMTPIHLERQIASHWCSSGGKQKAVEISEENIRREEEDHRSTTTMYAVMRWQSVLCFTHHEKWASKRSQLSRERERERDKLDLSPSLCCDMFWPSCSSSSNVDVMCHKWTLCPTHTPARWRKTSLGVAPRRQRIVLYVVYLQVEEEELS